MAHKTLPEEKLLELAAMYERGATMRECAEKFGTSKRVIRRLLVKQGVHIRTNSESHSLYLHIGESLKDSIINDYAKGMSMYGIADKFNVSPYACYTILKDNGKIRPRGWQIAGTHRSQETKNKISIKNKGHRTNPETTRKLIEFTKKLSREEKRKMVDKMEETKRRRGTWSISKPENQLYEQLKSTGKTVLRQYKDPRYPFRCDFYIKEDDLFIELNAHWTHGGRPFDPNDESCLKQLKEWEEKAKTSEFYRQAIEIWTRRDVEKAKVAKDNHLKYIAIYNIRE